MTDPRWLPQVDGDLFSWYQRPSNDLVSFHTLSWLFSRGWLCLHVQIWLINLFQAVGKRGRSVAWIFIISKKTKDENIVSANTNWWKISHVGTACHSGVRCWKVYLPGHASVATEGDSRFVLAFNVLHMQQTLKYI